MSCCKVLEAYCFFRLLTGCCKAHKKRYFETEKSVFLCLQYFSDSLLLTL